MPWNDAKTFRKAKRKSRRKNLSNNISGFFSRVLDMRMFVIEVMNHQIVFLLLFLRLKSAINGKYTEAKKNLETIKELTANLNLQDIELQKIEKSLTEFDPYSESIEQNQQTLDLIATKLNNKNLIQKINESLEEICTPELATALKNLELKVEKLSETMEIHQRAFENAKALRREYLFNTEKVQHWINVTEDKLKGHFIEPLEYKISIHNCCHERAPVSEHFENACKSGQLLMQFIQDPNEVLLIKQNLEETRNRLTQVFLLLDEQRTIIDNLVDAWSKFMELYQIIINWASQKRIFVGQEMKLNNLKEAHVKLIEYSVRYLISLDFIEDAKHDYLFL